ERRPDQLADPSLGDRPAQPATRAAFDPAEQAAPQRLRTGMAAPQASEQVGEQPQAQCQHREQAQQHADIAWPQGQPEQVEAACLEAQQQRLPAVPAQPGQGMEPGQQGHGEPGTWAGDGRQPVHPSGTSWSSAPGIGRSRYPVTALAAAVTVQNMKNPTVYPSPRLTAW